MVQIIGLMRDGRCMAVVLTLNVPDAATGRVFSIEDRIWDRQRTSVSTAVGRMLRARWALPQQARTRGGRFADDLIAALRQMPFRARNAPYTSDDLSYPLISQQMRPPSERVSSAFGSLKVLLKCRRWSPSFVEIAFEFVRRS